MKKTNKHIDYTQDTEKISRYAKALSHPVRVKIIKYLSETSFCQTSILMDFLPLSQSTISQHLKELRNAGLIVGEVNPPKVRYCINHENWLEAKSLFCEFFNIDMKDHNCKI